MPTLSIQNVPEELCEALRKRAEENCRSISAEVLKILEENVPTAAELARRRDFIKFACELQAQPSPGPGPFPSAEEMLREDRSR